MTFMIQYWTMKVSDSQKAVRRIHIPVLRASKATLGFHEYVYEHTQDSCAIIDPTFGGGNRNMSLV